MTESQCVELMEVLTNLGVENGGEFTTSQYAEMLEKIRRESVPLGSPERSVYRRWIKGFLSGCNCVVPLGKYLWYTSGFRLEDAGEVYEESEDFDED